MDPLSSTLCLLLGSALPLTALWFFLARGMRQFQVSSAYGEVSRQLGLDVDTRGMSLQGHLGDRRIWIGEVMVGHGPERQMMTWGVLDLTRPLNLGFLVRRKGRTTRLLRGRSAPDAPIGDEELDRVLQVQGDEPGRVRAMFSPNVRQALRALMDVWPEVAITDRSVRVHMARPEASIERLQLLVSSMLGLAEALEEARKEVETPARLDAEVPAWTELAERMGLQIEPWIPAISGEFEGHRVLVSTRRQTDGYQAGLRLWFKAHDDTGLRLRLQNEPDGYWSVGQDIQIGDATFDDSFVIKGWDPQVIRDLLNDDARVALLELSEHGQPEVDDRCIDVEHIPLSVSELEQAIHAAVSLAKALGW